MERIEIPSTSGLSIRRAVAFGMLLVLFSCAGAGCIVVSAAKTGVGVGVKAGKAAGSIVGKGAGAVAGAVTPDDEPEAPPEDHR